MVKNKNLKVNLSTITFKISSLQFFSLLTYYYRIFFFFFFLEKKQEQAPEPVIKLTPAQIKEQVSLFFFLFVPSPSIIDIFHFLSRD